MKIVLLSIFTAVLATCPVDYGAAVTFVQLDPLKDNIWTVYDRDCSHGMRYSFNRTGNICETNLFRCDDKQSIETYYLYGQPYPCKAFPDMGTCEGKPIAVCCATPPASGSAALPSSSGTASSFYQSSVSQTAYQSSSLSTAVATSNQGCSAGQAPCSPPGPFTVGQNTFSCNNGCAVLPSPTCKQ